MSSSLPIGNKLLPNSASTPLPTAAAAPLSAPSHHSTSAHAATSAQTLAGASGTARAASMDSPLSSSSSAPQLPPGEQLLQTLQIGGIDVWQVRKGQQVVYKLANNLSAHSLDPQQRKFITDEIMKLHAADRQRQQQQFLEHQRQQQQALAMAAFTAQAQQLQANGGAARLASGGFSTGPPSLQPQQPATTTSPLNAPNALRSMASRGGYSPAIGSRKPGGIPTHPYLSTAMAAPRQPHLSRPSTSTNFHQPLAQNSHGRSSISGAAAIPTKPTMHSIAPSAAKPAPSTTLFSSSQHPSKTVSISRELAARHMQIRQSVAEALRADQKAVLEPNVKDPFRSEEDAIQRLLPYHVFEYPDGDFACNLGQFEADVDHNARILDERFHKLQTRLGSIRKRLAKQPQYPETAFFCERVTLVDEQKSMQDLRQRFNQTLRQARQPGAAPVSGLVPPSAIFPQSSRPNGGSGRKDEIASAVLTESDHRISPVLNSANSGGQPMDVQSPEEDSEESEDSRDSAESSEEEGESSEEDGTEGDSEEDEDEESGDSMDEDEP